LLLGWLLLSGEERQDLRGVLGRRGR